MDLNLSLNPNKVVQFLQKAPQEITKADLIRFVKENGIRMVNVLTAQASSPSSRPETATSM